MRSIGIGYLDPYLIWMHGTLADGSCQLGYVWFWLPIPLLQPQLTVLCGFSMDYSVLQHCKCLQVC